MDSTLEGRYKAERYSRGPNWHTQLAIEAATSGRPPRPGQWDPAILRAADYHRRRGSAANRVKERYEKPRETAMEGHDCLRTYLSLCQPVQLPPPWDFLTPKGDPRRGPANPDEALAALLTRHAVEAPNSCGLDASSSLRPSKRCARQRGARWRPPPKAPVTRACPSLRASSRIETTPAEAEKTLRFRTRCDAQRTR